MMKKIGIFLLAVFLLLCGCGNNKNNKTINIAVMGSPNAYYEKGIRKAYSDIREEYKDSGFDIKCEFYNDEDSYAEAEKITASLVSDKSVTAIIASPSEEICENQAYQTDKNNKILICPHWIYDDMLTNSNYDKVFALNHSANQIGRVMKSIAEKSEAEKWAVCYSDDEISKDEIKDFCNGVNVVDSVKMNVLASEFNKTVSRWELLGVEGIVFLPYDDSGFELLYKLKKEMPQILVVSDSNLDDNDELQANRDSFSNVYIVDSFYISDEKSDVFESRDYIDTWEIHGYNALKMIVDTSVKNNTDSAEEIAKYLHKDGYFGECESYKFNSNGVLMSKKFSYIEITPDDITEHIVSISNEVK